MRRTSLLLTVLGWLAMLSSPASAQQLVGKPRVIPFKGGSVTVTRQGNVDQVRVTGSKGEGMADSMCYMPVGSYDQFASFFKRFVSAYRGGRRAEIAAMVAYPLQVNGVNSVRVDSSTSLLKQFGNVFTPNVNKAILTAQPEVVFCRDDAAMLADGEIWARLVQGQIKVVVVNH